MSRNDIEYDINNFKTEVHVHLGDRIKDIRVKSGMTQKKLAELVEMSDGQLNKIEKGKQENPSIKTIISISGALGVSLDELVYGEDVDMTTNALSKSIESLSEDDKKTVKLVIAALTMKSI